MVVDLSKQVDEEVISELDLDIMTKQVRLIDLEADLKLSTALLKQ